MNHAQLHSNLQTAVRWIACFRFYASLPLDSARLTRARHRLASWRAYGRYLYRLSRGQDADHERAVLAQYDPEPGNTPPGQSSNPHR